MTKISLLGGSFDPIQNAHIKIIKYLFEKKISDEVWVMPCGNHVFKGELSNAEHRKKMIELAIQGLDHVKLCNIELKSKEKSYSFETLKKLKKQFPNNEFYLVIGTDILQEIDKWHKYKELLQESSFIIFERKGYRYTPFPGMKVVHFIQENPDNISSTEIRARARKHQSISNFVPKQVETYINKNGLYT